TKLYEHKIKRLLSNSNIISRNMENYQKISREDFMKFFRDDYKLNELSVDDREEIFRTVLVGNSDFTKDLLDEVLSDYSVSNLEIIEIENGEK
ncbi:MAG: hypothetical protein WAT40_05710, partial [Saprospiraceae bacterium]